MKAQLHELVLEAVHGLQDQATLPAEPINNIATVEIVTTGTLGMTASGSTGGWKFDNKTGQLIANITAYQTR